MVLEVGGRGVDEPGPGVVSAPASSVSIFALTEKKRAISIKNVIADVPPVKPTQIKVDFR